ncbi:hypothetical protein, conserved [Eimeria necatrix]|uniref:PPM-type phosphatase domain-containing protein n=1 Tax=Eimeria necatrix TaxID=51315 RepID=U6MU84_9EIME|nr:hypothetical protein, conserved [Eimeria necatrix]CDJ67792.1 hypothetical protein, conserved [Eimeria necatrix]
MQTAAAATTTTTTAAAAATTTAAAAAAAAATTAAATAAAAAAAAAKFGVLLQRMKSRGDLLPSQQKVVALPHVRTLRVRAGDVLVYACDGVFEAQGMTWRFVANFVAMQLKASSLGFRATGGDLEAAVSRLVSAAYLMGSGDNISAMLLRLLPQPFEKPSVQKAEVDVLGVRTEVPAMLPSEATVQRSGAWVNELGLYATLY